mgnify:FL=1
MYDYGEWLSTEEAAQYWSAMSAGVENAVIRVYLSAQRFRKLCREGHLAAAGVEVMETTKGYLISRSDLVRGARRQCDAVCDRLAAEELAEWPGKKDRAQA